MNRYCFGFAIASALLFTACGGSSSNGSTSSSSSSPTNSSSSSSSSEPTGGPNEYDGDWTACDRFETLQGFASLGGGTTGGADQGNGNYELGVTTGAQIQNALQSSDYTDKPLIFYVDDLITWENSNGAIRIRRDDVSLIGRSGNAGFEGVGIEISHGASNIIIRNLELRLVPQSRSPGDLISIDGRDGAVSNVWIDHNELYNSLTAPASANCGNSENCHKDYYDELVSGRSEVHNLTISYNYLHDSWKTSLWGSSDSESEDAGRTITFHHNYWHNVNSRLPLFRYGEAHIFNNYYHNVDGSAINSRMGAEMRIDGNVFEDVSHPITSQFSDEVGFWDVEDNIFTGISASGSCNAGSSECRGAHEESTGNYIPPYNYDIMPASDVKDYVLAQAGAGKINQCLDLPESENNNGSTGFDNDPKNPPANWNIFAGDTRPDAEGAITLDTGTFASFTLGGNAETQHFSNGSDEGAVEFDTSASASLTHHATYRGVTEDGYPKHFTLLAGVRGYSEDIRLLEIETAFANADEAGSRLKMLLRNQDGHVGIQLEQANGGESIDNFGTLAMDTFRVYQLSVTLTDANRGHVRVFGDGNDEPLITLFDVPMRAVSSNGDNFVRIGDGGGHPYKSQIDWILWTDHAAYLPSDLKGSLPENIGNISGYEAN